MVFVSLFQNESIERKAEAEFGTLAVKCYYNDITNRLCVLLINGSNITPKDKSGRVLFQICLEEFYLGQTGCDFI